MHGTPSRAGQLWKGYVSVLPWLLAGWIGLSRIQDYWHHWEDVMVGGLIGHIAAYAMFRLRWAPTVDLPHTLLHLSKPSLLTQNEELENSGFFKEYVTGACTPCKIDVNV